MGVLLVPHWSTAVLRSINACKMRFGPAGSIILAGIASLYLVACEEPVSEPAVPGLESGYWQASITLPGGDIETGIEISTDGEIVRASLINSQERVPVNEVSFIDGELLLRFPAFNNEIRAVLSDGELRGEAMIVGSVLAKTMFTIMLAIARPHLPMRTFTETSKAKEWALALLK